MVAMSTKPAYTMNQLIDMAYTAILQTGLYKTPYVEFKGMEPANQIYATLKEHMLQTFKLRLQMGTAQGKNTAFNDMYNIPDDDSIGTITESIQNMQMVNNAAACTINKNMSAITCETADLRNIIEQMKQERTNFLYAPWQPTPPAPYTLVQPYQPSPPTYGMGPTHTAHTTPNVPSYIGGPTDHR